MNKTQLKQIEKQRELENFVSREVYYCQSMLVDEMLKREVFSYEDIINLYEYKCPDYGYGYQSIGDFGNETKREGEFHCPSCDKVFDKEPENEAQEIFEWWLCSNWLLEKLEAKGEPILRNDFGDWWGRCTTGQAICMDGVIKRVYDDLHRGE